MARDPTAEKVSGSLEVRRQIGNTSDWQRGSRPGEKSNSAAPVTSMESVPHWQRSGESRLESVA